MDHRNKFPLLFYEFIELIKLVIHSLNYTILIKSDIYFIFYSNLNYTSMLITFFIQSNITLFDIKLSANEDTDFTKFLFTFTQNILNSDRSIRRVGITDQNGNIINERDREGLQPFLTIEETHEWAIRTITRHKTRFDLESKMGKLTYLFRRYTRMSRCLIPINENYYLIFTMDFDQYDFDKIIMEKIIPFIKQEKEKFVTKKNESI